MGRSSIATASTSSGVTYSPGTSGLSSNATNPSRSTMLYTSATYRQYRTRFALSPPTRPCSVLDSRPLTSRHETRCSEFRSRTSSPRLPTLSSRTWTHPDALARVFRSRSPTAPSPAPDGPGGRTNSSTWFRSRRCASVRPASPAASDVNEHIRGRPSSGASRATHSSTMWPEQPMSPRRILPLAVEGGTDFLSVAEGFGCLLFALPSGLAGDLPLFFPDAAERSCLPLLVLAVPGSFLNSSSDMTSSLPRTSTTPFSSRYPGTNSDRAIFPFFFILGSRLSISPGVPSQALRR
mmetsp:Transcript_3523/g.7870  ORF Transcript_3523/g.7870 Transcript_3523/m.7870 type:complete len:294 (+) Transcript_3523:712-1593(+)